MKQADQINFWEILVNDIVADYKHELAENAGLLLLKRDAILLGLSLKAKNPEIVMDMSENTDKS